MKYYKAIDINGYQSTRHGAVQYYKVSDDNKVYWHTGFTHNTNKGLRWEGPISNENKHHHWTEYEWTDHIPSRIRKNGYKCVEADETELFMVML